MLSSKTFTWEDQSTRMLPNTAEYPERLPDEVMLTPGSCSGLLIPQLTFQVEQVL